MKKTKGFGLGAKTGGGKVDRKRAVDHVDLVARRVSYSLQADLFCALAHDFEVHEPGQQRQTATPDSQDISVEFDAEFSQEVVIKALESIVAEIKLNGLPAVRKQMDRRHAALVMDLQAEGAKLSRFLESLPADLRAFAHRFVKENIIDPQLARVIKRTVA
jgi:hypothetical protein